jgi:hypothetical protein
MYGDGHAMLIGQPENALHLCKVLRIGDVHVGAAEMKFQSSSQMLVLRAACDLFQCVRLQRVHTAEANQPAGYFATCSPVQSFSAFTIAYSLGTGGLLGLEKL